MLSSTKSWISFQDEKRNHTGFSLWHFFVYIICLSEDVVRYWLLMQKCQINWYLLTVYWKMAYYHSMYCTELIRWMDEDMKVSYSLWMVADMLSPQGPSLDAIFLAKAKDTHLIPSSPICHLTTWLAVTSVLCVKVSPTLALSWLSPFSLSIRLVIYNTWVISFVEEYFEVRVTSILY